MTESHEESAQHHASTSPALPRMVHLGIPIASILLLLTFAITIALPANHANLPVESTIFFIPIYVVIVIIFVFASMYLFKAIVEKDVSTTGH